MNDVTLNEWVEEEVKVKAIVPVIDKKNNVSYEEKEIVGKQKVMYIDPPTRTAICPRGKHDFFPHTPSRGIFACSRCSYKYKTYPISHEFYKDESGGHLRHKKTGQLV